MKEFRRDSVNGYLYGLCAGLERYTGLPALFYRALFIGILYLTNVIAGVFIYTILSWTTKDKETGAEERQKRRVNLGNR